MEFLHYLEPKTLVAMFGPAALVIIAFIVFAESGLFFGFFLPGDSLLFAAGVLAAQGAFSLPVLVITLIVAAIVGDGVGYWFGKNYGRRLFQREDSVWFHRKHLVTAHEFYEKHGGKAIILARFLPVVRTFVPIVAGIALMTYPRFLSFNVFGGVGWVLLLTSLGFFLGSLITDIDRYLLPIIVLIIFLSIAPTLWHLYRENKHQIHAEIRRRSKR